MKRTRLFSFLCLLGISSLLYACISKISQKGSLSEKSLAPLEESVGIATKKSQHIKWKNHSYFLPITISKFTRANLPCLLVQLNDNQICAILDLGFRGQLSFSSRFFEHLRNKKYLRSQKMYGIRGGEYEENLYEIPEVQIGSMSFSKPAIHEQAEEFHMESTLIKENNDPSSQDSGKVGWELFGNTNLFLDLGNSKIAFCDSLGTLKDQGYDIEKFTKTPLLLQRGLVEIEVEIPKGTLRCMLDTGATWNILNAEDGKSIDQAMLEHDNILDCTPLKIDGNDFGPMAFHYVPIKIPIWIEAILGMEFFKEHLVFLDFFENCAYISKRPASDQRPPLN